MPPWSIEPNTYPTRQSGVTLLELMGVVAIIGLLGAIAIPAYTGYVDRANGARALGDMGRIETRLQRFRLANNDQLPANLAAVGADTMLDPWGRPYQYLNILAGPPPGAMRKDHNLVPINTDFDLYSMGKDGASVPPLTGGPSRDDIVRANNGQFYGRAEDY